MRKHVDPHYPNFKYDNAVVPYLINLNDYFKQVQADNEIIFANDFQVETETRREELVDLLTKTYAGDTLDEPINGNNSLFEKVVPTVWLKPISDGKFIHPKFLSMLSKVVTRDKVDIVQHMIDPSYKLPEGLTPKGMVKNYLDANFPRGLKAFHDHFDEFANLLILDSFYRREQRREKNLGKKNSKRTNLDYIAMVILKYRDVIFCDYLPVPSKQVFVMEQRGKNKVSEVPLMQYAFDAVSVVTSLSSRIRPVSQREANRLDYKVNALMCEFYEKYSQNYLTSKAGIFRKNSYGTSSHWNARAVIVSKQGLQSYENINIPYSLGFKCFEQHIAKICIDEDKMTPIEIFEMRAEYARQFSPHIHGIMKRLIDDAWDPNGWPSNFMRHPFLNKLSSQYLPIGDVGTDPMDNTVEMPPMDLKAPNADFDGDEMVLTIHLDKYLMDLWSPTAPSEGALSQNEPLSYSDNLDIPKPMVLQLYRYLGYDKL